MNSSIASFFSRLARTLRWAGFLASISVVMTMALALIAYGIFRDEMPRVLDPGDYRPHLKSKVYAQNGELIAELGVHERILVEKEQIPPLIKQAFVASEDKKFFDHHGIDLTGMINAVLQSISGKRSTLRGASTITQQLAKGLLIREDGYEKATARTIGRKIKEAIFARRLEMSLSKEDILHIYLNDVYLGHGAYGVAAAAKNYFQKDLRDLTLGEIAIIAGLPQAPSRYSPQINMKAALARQSYVLKRMVDDGYITGDQMRKAITANNGMKVYDRKNAFRTAAPYFAEVVRQKLIEEYGEDTVYQEGLKIYTTLNIEHARAMQRILKNGLIDIDKRQGFLGPIYRPSTGHERKAIRSLLGRMGEEGSIRLPAGFFLALVEGIDEAHRSVRIDVAGEAGVISLADMRWARKRNPKVSHAEGELKSVSGVLEPGDVVLVKRRAGVSAQDPISYFTLEQEPAVEGAMFSLEPASGYLTALIGGYSFDRSEFNRVFQACRQPGSAFKPVVYAAAIEHLGYTPATMVMDAPLTFHDHRNQFAWKPKNLGGYYQGEVTVREALLRSMNVPALNVMATVGIKNVIGMAERLGIETPLKHELGTAIGSSCISPWELARVYSAIANMGRRVLPIMIKEVIDRDGHRLRFTASKSDPWIRRSDRVFIALRKSSKKTDRVLSKETAYIMHSLLMDVVKNGSAKRANAIGRRVAGKTGTTNDSFDTWFAGYSKELLTVLWVGYDTMEQPLGVYEQGGRTALPLFVDYMKTVLAGLVQKDWPRPASICEARIDGRTGLRIEGDHPLSFIAPFRCGSVPPLLSARPQESLEQAMEMLGGS